jgi:hypothetical protein
MFIFQAWSKEETDQLFDLCECFDLRFIVIADRFPTDHNVENLKSRYYSGNLSCYSNIACFMNSLLLLILYGLYVHLFAQKSTLFL